LVGVPGVTTGELVAVFWLFVGDPVGESVGGQGLTVGDLVGVPVVTVGELVAVPEFSVMDAVVVTGLRLGKSGLAEGDAVGIQNTGAFSCFNAKVSIW
jgi:hypothetical protein